VSHNFIAPLKALAACAAGGALCQMLHSPLPWMIGPLIAMAVLKFRGFDLPAPKGGRQLGQVVIASALGLYFTPVVAREVFANWYLLVAAAVFATALAYAGAFFLWRFANVDRTTAFFASVPGGAAEMSNLGERYGAKTDRIAVAQSLRIVFVVVLVPVAMTLLGSHGSDVYQPSVQAIDWSGLITLLGLCAGGGFVMRTLRLPNPWFLGALAMAIVLTIKEVHLSAMPGALSNAAQLLIGCSLGARFDQKFLKSAPHFVLVVSASILGAICISALFALLLAKLGGLSLPTMVLATAPGGVAEMCITAKVLQLGVPLVTAAQVTRVIILVTTTGPLFRLVRHLAGRMGLR
jgi:membrane AbrB-like protein